MHNKYLGGPIARGTGIGLRRSYYQEIIENKPSLGFLEVHPENYFGFGVEVDLLRDISQFYPISLHGVGLSLGSNDGISNEHLGNFKKLIDIINPIYISEHVSWSMTGNAHLNDLLPLPYNKESIRVICENIDRAQNFLGREILVENPSSYLTFKDDMPEHEFLNIIVEKTGCGLLLDVNNVYVNSQNHGFDAYHYVKEIPSSSIGEIHLAGHSVQEIDGKTIRIDTHDNLVEKEVWNLYYYTVEEKGIIPTLIEWDQKFPELGVVLGEAEKAARIQDHFRVQENVA